MRFYDKITIKKMLKILAKKKNKKNMVNGKCINK